MDDDEEDEMVSDQVQNVGEDEIHNVEVPSKKPKWTKTFLKKRRTPEKKRNEGVEEVNNDIQQYLQIVEAELMPEEAQNVLIKTLSTRKKKVKEVGKEKNDA